MQKGILNVAARHSHMNLCKLHILICIMLCQIKRLLLHVKISAHDYMLDQQGQTYKFSSQDYIISSSWDVNAAKCFLEATAAILLSVLGEPDCSHRK